MAVEVDRHPGRDQQLPEMRPVGVGVKRHALVDDAAPARELGRRRAFDLAEKRLADRVVHVADTVLDHGDEVHHHCIALRELRGVDAGVAGIACRSLVVVGEKIDVLIRAGRPGVRNRQIERVAAAHLFDSSVAAVEMVEKDVVDGVGGIGETCARITRPP